MLDLVMDLIAARPSTLPLPTGYHLVWRKYMLRRQRGKRRNMDMQLPITRFTTDGLSSPRAGLKAMQQYRQQRRPATLDQERLLVDIVRREVSTRLSFLGGSASRFTARPSLPRPWCLTPSSVLSRPQLDLSTDSYLCYTVAPELHFRGNCLEASAAPQGEWLDCTS